VVRDLGCAVTDVLSEPVPDNRNAFGHVVQCDACIRKRPPVDSVVPHASTDQTFQVGKPDELPVVRIDHMPKRWLLVAKVMSEQ